MIARLAEHPHRLFADQSDWSGHLDRLGISALKVTPDPIMVATEGALWGSVKAHGFLPNTVIVSDDAGQFNVGQHGLCWVHAERLIHKLDTFTDQQRDAQSSTRELIWRFYRDLKAYRLQPTKRGKAALRARFDRIFTRRTGFVTLDRLLARLHANKRELLMVLDRPESRCTPTARKTTSAAKSPNARSAAAQEATPGATAATPSLASARLAQSSASPSGIISDHASPCQTITTSQTYPPSSGTAAHPPDSHEFCPYYERTP